jgi:hypothetical protein
VNELEERRVIRVLNEVASVVEPLPPEDVDDVLHSATLGVSRLRPRRAMMLHARTLLAPAAAAALILGTTLVAAVPGSQPSPADATAAPAQLASFPEGSALQLLLSRNSSRDAS